MIKRQLNSRYGYYASGRIPDGKWYSFEITIPRICEYCGAPLFMIQKTTDGRVFQCGKCSQIWKEVKRG